MSRRRRKFFQNACNFHLISENCSAPPLFIGVLMRTRLENINRPLKPPSCGTSQRRSVYVMLTLTTQLWDVSAKKCLHHAETYHPAVGRLCEEVFTPCWKLPPSCGTSQRRSVYENFVNRGGGRGKKIRFPIEQCHHLKSTTKKLMEMRERFECGYKALILVPGFHPGYELEDERSELVAY